MTNPNKKNGYPNKKQGSPTKKKEKSRRNVVTDALKALEKKEAVIDVEAVMEVVEKDAEKNEGKKVSRSALKKKAREAILALKKNQPVVKDFATDDSVVSKSKATKKMKNI
ncbi:hypothetical protein CTI12_AA414460 [Artemisia annua]|uniref:Uncharacterized protein n=1 Tax=Artemisia annua TaxID=35608 RepID=A0A2U1M675_ARTAN|nr:hypothetical protein CTI12_AA414460 [Artemisia annua]